MSKLKEYDSKELAKAIENMDSVCAKGKKEISVVLEAAGFKLESPGPELKLGQVWTHLDSIRIFVNVARPMQPLKEGIFFVHSGKAEPTAWKHATEIGYKFLANSLPEYIQKLKETP